MKAKTKETSLRARRAGVMSDKEVPGTRTQVESLQGQIAYLQNMADLHSIRADKLARAHEILDQRLIGERATSVARNRALIESLIQERTELLGRMQRIDQRLRCLSVEPACSAFDLAIAPEILKGR
jgi:hypothetical protein